MRLIDADKLAERVENLEAVALEQVLKYEPSEEHEKWKVWSAILNERTAFKFDLFDAPTVDPYKHGHWISIDNDGDSPYKCSVCGGVIVNENGEWLDICQQEWSKMPYCSVCGAKMDERET